MLITYYIEHDTGDDDTWPDWQEVSQEMFCKLANEYRIDHLGTLWEVTVTQDEETCGLRLMLRAKG